MGNIEAKLGRTRRGGQARRGGEAHRGGQARRRSPVPDWVPDDLPAAPGVYQFEAEGGTILYVGKSVNLKRRVRGWFYGGGPDDARLAEMLALARSVTIRRTGSDLEARLEEAERIIGGRPRYNRALKNRARGWYLEIDWRDPFPGVRVTRSVRSARARYFGPYRGRALPERIARRVERVFRLRSCSGRIVPDADGSPCLARGLDLCTAPCIAEVGLDAYRRQVECAARALADPAWARALRDRLVERRDAASAALEYEAAGRLQRRIGWIDELEADRQALESPWVEGSWLLALPHAREGWSLLVPFVGGRVLSRRSIERDAADRADRLRDACYRVRVAALAGEPVLEPAALAPSLIVSGWMLDGAPGGLPVDLERCADEEAVERIERWCDDA